MFFPDSQAEYHAKSKDKWKCLPKRQEQNNMLYQSSKTQKCSKYTPSSSPVKKQFKLLKVFNERKEQQRLRSPIPKLNSKQKNLLQSFLNLPKQPQQNKVQQKRISRLQKKGSRYQKSQIYGDPMSNNGSIDISKIGCHENKSFLGSIFNKRGICQLLNLDEKEIILRKNLIEYKKIIKQFKHVLKRELQSMHEYYVLIIYSLKNRYEEEIQQLKAVLSETKKDNLGQSDKLQYLGIDSVRFNSSTGSNENLNAIRRSNKIGSIVKCKKLIASSTTQQQRRNNFGLESTHSKQSSMRINLLQRSQKSTQQKFQRERSFDKIFSTLQVLKDTMNLDDKDAPQKQGMQTSQIESSSMLESNVKETQWGGVYSFKLPQLGSAALIPVPTNIKKITFQQNSECFKQEKEKDYAESDDLNTNEDQQMCEQLANIGKETLRPPLLNHSQDLYGSIRTACFDNSDSFHNQLLSPKKRKQK